MMNKVISSYAKKEFERGKYDCCMFAADVVLAKTGIDPAKNHRGKYTTKLGAIKALKKYGTMVEILDSHFERLDNINFAQRGDIVTFKNGRGVGVVWLGCILGMNPDHKGLVKASGEVEYIWRTKRV